MAAPTQLVITLTVGGNVTVPIAANLQDGSQAGLSGPDVTLATILKRGYFWNGTTAYPATAIKSVTYQ